MVRYADDLVILCRPGQGGDLKERLARWLQARGLALNEAKTRVLESREEGFGFLGFSFRWQQSKKGTFYVNTRPGAAAEQALRDRVHELTRRGTTWRDPHSVVREINQTTRGWGQYFGVSHYKHSFVAMNHFITERLRRWLRRKHGTSGMYARWPDSVLVRQYGLYVLPTAMS